MLSDITREFEERNPGVASFETFAAECMNEIGNDGANASLYFLLGVTARHFHDRFADRPLTVSAANESKDMMLALAREAVGVLDAPADNRYDVLNRIALAAFGGAD
jgi:hypothetical protein